MSLICSQCSLLAAVELTEDLLIKCEKVTELENTVYLIIQENQDLK